MSVAIAPQHFPDVLAGMQTNDLLAIYAAAPARLRLAIEGLSGEHLSSKPFDGKWSIQQIVHHLADSELVGSVRLRFAISGQREGVGSYDQDLWANELHYAQRCGASLELSIQLFEAQRAVNSDLFARLSADAWQSNWPHPTWGSPTVRQLLELYADHSERHLSQIVDRRKALHMPLIMVQLLTKRLY
jgi:hypothetical protein